MGPSVKFNYKRKHRINCECCPGHSLNVSHYYPQCHDLSSMSCLPSYLCLLVGFAKASIALIKCQKSHKSQGPLCTAMKALKSQV